MSDKNLTPRLELINLDGLIERILSQMDDNLSLSLGEFIPKTPKKDSFLRMLRRRKSERTGKYPLIMAEYGRGVVSAVLSTAVDREIGYVFIELGKTEESECAGIYESIKIRFKKPVCLKDGKTIPKCAIKVLVEKEEMAEQQVYRRDHKRVLGLGWRRIDLLGIIPNSWFLYTQEHK